MMIKRPETVYLKLWKSRLKDQRAVIESALHQKTAK